MESDSCCVGVLRSRGALKLETQTNPLRADLDRCSGDEEAADELGVAGGGGDRERELAVELPRDAPHERRGDEYREQHEGRGDDRSRDLAHGSDRRVL